MKNKQLEKNNHWQSIIIVMVTSAQNQIMKETRRNRRKISSIISTVTSAQNHNMLIEVHSNKPRQ
jgi:hypothetical protein